MSDARDRPVVLRLTGPRVVLGLVALVLLVSLAAWGGYRLGRWNGGGSTLEEAGRKDEPDAPMVDGGEAGAEGFTAAVDISSGYAVVYRRTGSAAEARQAREELEAKGLPVRIDHDARRPREDAFRVLVGPYPDRKAALAAARDLGRADVARGDLVFLE